MLEGGFKLMSNKIDQRIVEMSFENHKFEKGIQQSKQSLKDFANTLEQTGTGKDFKGLENSIQSASASLSMLEQVGIGALRRIGEAAVSAGSQLLKSLTIDPLAGGWTKYEQKTASVQTIMNATGKSIDEVNGYLDKLMWFSDETSYGFTDMTAALAQMTSSGGDIDTLIPLITGVANATAYAGKGANEFSRAMYNLNQSYGMGSLQFMDWRSLDMAGVGGKELKQIFIDTGKAMGRLDAEGRTLNGTLVNIGTFGASLQTKWADTKVMEAAFGKFSELSEAAYELVKDGTYDTAAEAMEFLSGKYSEVAEKGFKSAQQAKSFSEAISATLDSVSSGWMRTYEVIFGFLPEATANFTTLSEVLWTVFASSAKSRNAMLQLIKDSGGVASVFQSIKNVGVALLKPLKAISEAFDQFFPPKTADQWVSLLNILESFTSKLIMTDETADKLRRTFAGFFAVLDIGWQTLKFVGSAFVEILRIFIPLNGNLFEMTASFGDFLVILNKVIKETGVFQYALLGVKVAAVIIRDILVNLSIKVGEFVHTLLTTERPLEFLGETVKKLFAGVIESLQAGSDWISSKFLSALSSVQKFFDNKLQLGDSGVITTILTAFKDFLVFVMNDGSSGITSLGDALNSLDFSRIATFVTGGVLLLFVNQLTNLTQVLAGLGAAATSFVTKFSKKMFGTITKFKDLAMAVAVLTVSLYVLSQIPWDKLKVGLGGLAGAMLIFVAAYGAMQAITVIGTKKLNGAKAMESALSLTAMAGSLAIMAIALEKVSKIDETKVWNSVLVVGAMMGVVAAYEALTVAISIIPGTRSATSGVSVMASGLLGLIGIVVLLNFIKPETIETGIKKLAAALFMIAGIQALFGLAARVSGGNKVSLNLIGMSVGILALIGVVKLLTFLERKEISEGVSNILLFGGVLAAMQLMFNLAGLVGKGVVFKTHILSMQMGIVSMIALVAILGVMDQKKIQNGIINLTKMAGIIAGLEILTALAARLGGGNKVQKILGSVSVTMLAFTVLIGVLGIYKEETIDQGLGTIKKMMGMILELQLFSALIGQLRGSAVGLSMVVGIVSTLLTLTASLALLTMIDQTALTKASAAMSAVVFSVGIMATGLGILTKSLAGLSIGFSGLKVIVKNIIPGFVIIGTLVVAAIALMGILKWATPIIDGVSWATLTKFSVGLGFVAVLMTAFSVLAKVPGLGTNNLAGLAPGLIGAGVLIIATSELFKEIGSVSQIIDNLSWASIEKFIVGIGIIGVLVGGLTALGKPLMALGTGIGQAVLGVLAAIAGAALIIMAFVGLASLMEGLFAGNEDFLIQGLDKMVIMGEGLGRFVGALAGGFSSEVMVSFGKGLAEFAAAVGVIDPASFDGIDALAGAILALTGASILDGLARIIGIGGDPGKVFGEQINGLVLALSEVPVESAKKATAVLAALRPMTENLIIVAEATQSIPNSGGFLGGFLGDNNADDFGDDLNGFIRAFVPITVTATNHATEVLAALSPMAWDLKEFASAANRIPNSKGFMGGFLGDNDIDTFGKMLTTFIRTFSVIDVDADVNKATASLSAMKPMMEHLKVFAETADTIPDSGGALSWLAGDNAIDKFTDQILDLVKNVAKIDQRKISDSSSKMAYMSSTLMPGLERFISMFNSLKTTGGLQTIFVGKTSFTALAEEIKSFVAILKGVDVSVVAPALASLDQINESFKIVGKEIVESAILSIQKNKVPFQSAIVDILDSAIFIANKKREGISDSFMAMLDKTIVDSRTYIDDFRILGYDLVRGLQNGISLGKTAATFAMDKMAGSVINTARDTFEVRSPSKVFEEIGRWLPIGLGQGIARNSKVAILASANMAGGVEDAVRSTLQVYSPSDLFIKIGEWVSTSLGSGMESTKSSLLETAKNLGIDTTTMTVQGLTEGMMGGEGAVTAGINSLLEILTGKSSVAEVAAKMGIETGELFSDGLVNGVDQNAIKSAYGGATQDAFQIFKASIDKRREYNLMSASEEIAAWQEFAKKYAEGTEMRMRADKEVGRLRFEFSKKWIDKEKYYKRLSLEAELTAWEAVQSRYQKGHEYRLQAEREIFRLKEEMWQAEYQNSLAYVDEEKYYGRMNLSEELSEMKKVQAMTKDGSDERKKADREIFRLENEIRDTNLAYEEQLQKVEADRTEKRKRAADEYYAKEKEINTKMINDIKNLKDVYANAVDSRAKTLYSTYNLFDKVEKPKYVSGFELINNLEDQNTAFDKWQNSIGALAAKGIDEGLIKELRDMGPKSLAQINALNRLSDSELSRYVDLWQKKSKEAKDQAVFELQDLALKTDQEIKQITADAEIELGYYRGVWNTKLSEINADTKVQLDKIQADWTKSIGSMTESGITIITKFKKDWFGEIVNIVDTTKSKMAELKTITENLKPMTDAVTVAVNNAVNASAKVPPKTEVIGQNIANGVTKGIVSNTPTVTKAVNNLGTQAYSDLTSFWMIKSPSRKTMEIGKFIVMGLADGIKQFSGLVSTESQSVGANALEAMSTSMTSIPDLLGDDLGAFTITPVLDLSQVQTGMGDVRSILSGMSGLDLSNTMRLLPKSSQTSQNGILNELRNGLLSMSNPSVDLDGKLTVEVVNDKGEIVGIAETAIRDLLRRESR
jgi:hypothetical protein